MIIRAGEHPFVKWDTCLAYALAEISSASSLAQVLDQGRAELRQDVSPGLLALVLEGFLASDFTKERVRDYVRRRRQDAREA